LQRVAVNGYLSDWVSVLSGVPQGSVLGLPLLFILHVNDILDLIESTTRMFADDTKIYSDIKSFNDRPQLQQNIHIGLVFGY